MNKKIIVFFVVLLFALSMVWAGNNTTDTLEVEDNGHYILPISISDGEIKFNDGFTGFNINPDKNNAGMSDKFLLDDFNGKNIENTVKSVIIEAYKQGKEHEIAQILTKLNNGDSNDDVIKEALNSHEKIGSNPVVKIDNSTEATFNFEYLKSVDDEKSDCIAYTVSMKTVEEPEILSTPSDDSGNQPVDETGDEDNDKTADNQNKETDNQKQTDDSKKSDDNTQDNQKQTDDNNKSDNDTTVNETNKTIVNKTNTVIVNETNTTIINNNNVKTINNTNDTPQNDTTSQLLKAAGNPIFILIIVIVIITIIAVAVRRKD